MQLLIVRWELQGIDPQFVLITASDQDTNTTGLFWNIIDILYSDYV